MQALFTKKLTQDVASNTVCNAVINGWIAKLIADAKTPPQIATRGPEFFADILLTTFLIFIIVFAVARHMVGGKLQQKNYDMQAVPSRLLAALHLGAPLRGSMGRASLRIFLVSCLLSALVFGCFQLCTAPHLTAWGYAIFKALWCAFVGALATVCAFGAAAYNTPEFKS